MINNAIVSLKNVVCIGLVCLVGLYAKPVLSRTLIFQSGSESAVNKQLPADQTVVNELDKIKPLNTNVNVANASSANSELFFMIEQLQSEVNSLRGMLEEQSHELRMLKQSGKDRYLDLDTRILDLTKRAISSTSSIKSASINVDKAGGFKRSQPPTEKAIPERQASMATKQREPTAAEREAYYNAYALIKNKKFDESILALFAYTENYPKSPLMPNVYYWLGEVYLATSKLEQAKTSFSLVISAYPSNSKVSDSLYKLAVTLDRLGESSLAGQYLKEVQEKYPNSTASKLASSYKLSQ